MTRTNPGHPRLLVLDDPFQSINGLLLIENLLLEFVKTLQDHPHVDTDLVDILAMAIDAPRGVFDLPLVILEGLFFCNDIGSKIRFQLITLKRTVNLWLNNTKRLLSP